jgi:hypothetical protein
LEARFRPRQNPLVSWVHFDHTIPCCRSLVLFLEMELVSRHCL